MGVEIRPKNLRFCGLWGTALVMSGTLAFFTADKFVGKSIKHWSPKVQDGLSSSFRQPIKLGPYKGLRPWGVAFGATKILPGRSSSSTVNISSLTIKLAPLSSFLKLRPVIIIRPKDTEIVLIPNKKGSYWDLNTSEEGNNNNLEIQFKPYGNTQVLVEPSNLKFTATGKANFDLLQKRIISDVKVHLPEQGRLSLKGHGYWDGIEFKAKAKANRISLKLIEDLLPNNSEISAKGLINGDLKFGMNKGRLTCNGELLISDFKIRGNYIRDYLTTKETGIACKDDLLRIPSSIWKLGDWEANVAARIPIKKSSQINLSLLSSVRLKNLKDSDLNIQADLPLRIEKKRLYTGDLKAKLKLDSFPLASLSSLLKNNLAGKLSLNGIISGPLSAFKSEIDIKLENPQWNGIRLREKWRGSFKRIPSDLNFGRIDMESEGASVPASLTANLTKTGILSDLLLKRLGGEIYIKSQSNLYEFNVDKFRLDRIEVALPPERSFKRIFGEISGKGNVELAPFRFSGALNARYPRLMGLKLKEANLQANFENTKGIFSGELVPSDQGRINFDFRTDKNLFFQANVDNISPKWIAQTSLEIPKIGLSISEASGKAEDLGQASIQNSNTSLDNQFKELIKAQLSVQRDMNNQNKKSIINPDNLSGGIDAEVTIEGKDIDSLEIDIKSSGEIFNNQFKVKDGLDVKKPFTASLHSSVAKRKGSFSFDNVPFSTLSLIIPFPNNIDGFIGFDGNYSFAGNALELFADLTFRDAIISGESLLLERGKFHLFENVLDIDVALQGESSSYPVELVGKMPLSTSLPIDLKIESHGDGLAFLDGLSDGFLSWDEGTADLSLLVRGSFQEPIANGFLVLKNGKIDIKGKQLENLESTILFDFNRIEVKELKSNVLKNGILRSSGSIALFKPMEEEEKPLSIHVENTRLQTNFSDAILTSDITILGSLLFPRIGGEIVFDNGFISAQNSGSTKSDLSVDQNDSVNSSLDNVRRLPEEDWDQVDPLVLFIEDENSPASKILRTRFPESLSSVSFDNLKLILGPSLRLSSQPLASFETVGSLILNGALDETLNASGVVRLTSGYVNLFTTTFNLDNSEPNVAVFVPSMGLVPYVDVTMKSRVADNIKDISSNEFSSNGLASFGIGGSRFIKVEVEATGPADRLSENFQLRSTPTMTRNQLLGLIGGNSLNKLLSGGEGEVLVDLLNRSFVSFLQGSLDGALSDRLQFSLYPAYVNGPELENKSGNEPATSIETNTGSLSPQQAWVTEIGIDLTERINFALQVTPNRQDIPSQGNIAFQINPSVGLLGSFDKNGKWQSQVQVYLRY